MLECDFERGQTPPNSNLPPVSPWSSTLLGQKTKQNRPPNPQKPIRMQLSFSLFFYTIQIWLAGFSCSSQTMYWWMVWLKYRPYVRKKMSRDEFLRRAVELSWERHASRLIRSSLPCVIRCCRQRTPTAIHLWAANRVSQGPTLDSGNVGRSFLSHGQLLQGRLQPQHRPGLSYLMVLKEPSEPRQGGQFTTKTFFFWRGRNEGEKSTGK